MHKYHTFRNPNNFLHHPIGVGPKGRKLTDIERHKLSVIMRHYQIGLKVCDGGLVVLPNKKAISAIRKSGKKETTIYSALKATSGSM